jgi:hypothetical protein
MRFLVAGAIYLASGALFRTMDTVADEKPLSVATSRIVTVELLLLWRLNAGLPPAPSSFRHNAECNLSRLAPLL